MRPCSWRSRAPTRLKDDAAGDWAVVTTAPLAFWAVLLAVAAPEPGSPPWPAVAPADADTLAKPRDVAVLAALASPPLPPPPPAPPAAVADDDTLPEPVAVLLAAAAPPAPKM